MGGSKEFDTAHDFPPMSQPSNKQILVFDRENPVRFTDLIDTINTYAGYGGYFLMVKLTEDGITVSPVEVESDKFYQHIQSVASNTWYVNHNLGKYPSVTITDSSDQVMGAVYSYVDPNNLVVYFEYELTGKVNCN